MCDLDTFKNIEYFFPVFEGTLKKNSFVKTHSDELLFLQVVMQKIRKFSISA